MRRPLAALLSLVCGCAAAPDVEACSIRGPSIRDWISPEAVVVTGRVVRLVSKVIIEPRPVQRHEWREGQETYGAAPAGPVYRRVWGLELEPLVAIGSKIPRRLRIYQVAALSEDCRISLQSKEAVLRLHQVGDTLGVRLRWRPVFRAKDVVDVTLFRDELTRRSRAERVLDTYASDLVSLSRQVHHLWTRQPEERNEQAPLLKQVEFEAIREAVRLGQATTEKQRMHHLLRLWALYLGHAFPDTDLEYRRCESVDIVSTFLPRVAAQARFVGQLRAIGLPTYDYVDKTPGTIGCASEGKEAQ